MLDAEFGGRGDQRREPERMEERRFPGLAGATENPGEFAGLEERAPEEELDGITEGVVDDMEAMVLARYAAIVHGSPGAPSAEMEAEIKCTGRPLRDLVRYRRCRQGEERTQIQRETIEVKRQKTEEGQRKAFMELARNPKIQEKLRRR